MTAQSRKLHDQIFPKSIKRLGWVLRRAAADSTDAPKIHSHFRQINISIQTVCIAFSKRNSRAAAALHRFWGGNVFILAAAVEAIKRITWTDEAIMKPSQCGEREGRRVYSPLVRPPQALKAFSRAPPVPFNRAPPENHNQSVRTPGKRAAKRAGDKLKTIKQKVTQGILK